MVQSILSNIAIILLMHLVMSMLTNMRREKGSQLASVAIVFVVAASVISMFYLPISFNGYALDMRFIPLIFLAYIQGWKLAIPALIISLLWRYFMGGAGAVPGIFYGMVGPTLLALVFHHRSKLHGRYVEKIMLVVACWLISDVPIIFYVPNGLEFFKNIALIRSSTFIGTAVILYTFIILERQRKSLNERLERLAGEDPLTKLLNKRRFYEIVREKRKSLKPQHFIAMMDIDHFKKLNDTYGHIIGDDVLMKVGKLLKTYEHDHLKIARYGGEEFIVYLGHSSFSEAEQILESIRRNIAETCFVYDQGKTICTTISIGIAELKPEASLLTVVNEADQYLYQAKKSGRNRVVTGNPRSCIKTS